MPLHCESLGTFFWALKQGDGLPLIYLAHRVTITSAIYRLTYMEEQIRSALMTCH